MKDIMTVNKKSNFMFELIAIVLGVLFTNVLNNIGNMSLIITILYCVTMIVLSIWIKKPILLAIVFFLTYPPFIEYELAMKTIVAYRREGITGIRDNITFPIMSFIDIYLYYLLAYSKNYKKYLSLPKKGNVIPIVLLIMLILLVSIINITFSDNYEIKLAILSGVNGYIKIIITYNLVKVSVVDKNDIRKILLAIVIATPVFLLESAYVTYVKYGYLSIGKTQFSGLLAGPGATGAFLVIIIPILICSIIIEKRRRSRFLIICIFIMSLVYSLLTYTRSVYLGLIISIIYIFYYFNKIQTLKKYIKVIALCTILFIIIFITYSGEFIIKKFISTFTENPLSDINLSARVFYWNYGLELIKKNILLGNGPNTWGLKTITGGTNLHNGYLQILYEIGLLGFILYFAIIFIQLKKINKTIKLYYKNNFDKDLFLISTCIKASIVGYLFTQLFSSSITSTRSVFLLWLIIFLIEKIYSLAMKNIKVNICIK